MSSRIQALLSIYKSSINYFVLFLKLCMISRKYVWTGKIIMTFNAMVTMKNPDLIMLNLDNWVSLQGNSKYFDKKNQVSSGIDLFPDFGIQQFRAELADSVGVLCDLPHRRAALEIGLGYFGSIHSCGVLCLSAL